MADQATAAVDLRVRFTWSDHGPATLDENAHLAFAPPPAAPGVYRWTLTGRPDQARPEVYIGEGGSLRRRLGDYRRPSGMATAGRLHDLYVAHLRAGGRLTLAIVTEVDIETATGATPLPLARRTARHLAEHAAIALAYLDTAVTVLNADTWPDDREESA